MVGKVLHQQAEHTKKEKDAGCRRRGPHRRSVPGRGRARAAVAPPSGHGITGMEQTVLLLMETVNTQMPQPRKSTQLSTWGQRKKLTAEGGASLEAGLAWVGS